MGDLLSSGVQVARHDITEYALPTDRGLISGDGHLVDFLRCVAVCVGRALLYQQFGDLPVNIRLKRATRRRCFGLPDEHIWLQSKIKLKINHWRSSPEPPELAGFYVDSVKFHFSFTNVPVH